MLNQSDSSAGGETAGADLRTLAHGCADARRLADAVILDQFQRWRSGRGRSAEEYLHEHPLLTADPELLLDVVYAEYRVRDELGQRPDQAEFLRRFPALSDSLRRQFEVGGWLHSDPLAANAATHVADAEAATLDQSALPLTLHDFELGPRLGAGAMGEVYAARQRSLNRPVAIKFLRREVTAGAERQRRFLREATAAAAVRHPGVVAIHGVGQDDGRLFLVLERVDGAGLDARLKAGPVPVDEALRITIALADALAAIHRAGVLHRDLKPSNVLLNRDGRVQVSDFGLAKPLDEHASSLSLEGQLIGTPQYMAPEQADTRWGPVGPATDIYGVGAVLFALLTGRPPATGDTLTTLLTVVARGEAQRSPQRLRADVPAPLDAVCQRCLAPPPGDRYATATELRDALLVCSPSSGNAARTATSPTLASPAPSNRSRRLWLWTAAAAACTTILVWVIRPPQQLPDAPAPSAAPPAIPSLVPKSEVVWQVEVFRQSRPDHSERLTESTPPLRTGDAVRIQVQFTAPQFAHLFWIGSDGTVRPLASTDNPPAQPVTRLSAPPSAADALPLTPPAGLELCVVVASFEPLESAAVWADRLQQLPHWTAPESETAIAGYSGRWSDANSASPDDAALSPDLQSQLSQRSRPVGAPVTVRPQSLREVIEAWRAAHSQPQAIMTFLALRHLPP